MPFSHYYGLWKNIPHCLTQIQMGLAGRLPYHQDFRRPPFLFGTEVFSLSEFNTKARREENLRDGHRKGFLFSGGQSQTAKRILIRRIEILFEPVRSTMHVD